MIGQIHTCLKNPVLGEGGLNTPCICFYHLIGQQFDFYFELKLKVFVMTKAVSNRDICFKNCSDSIVQDRYLTLTLCFLVLTGQGQEQLLKTNALYPNLPFEISYAFYTRILNSRKIKNVPDSPAFLAHYQGNKLVYNGIYI